MRLYLLFPLILLAACAQNPPRPQAPPPAGNHPKNFSVLQGVTTTESIQVNVLVPKTSSYDFWLIDKTGKAIAATGSELKKRTSSPWAIAWVRFDRLAANTQYRFVVRALGSDKILDERNLRTWKLHNKGLRLAIASCFHEEQAKKLPKIWGELLAQKPNALFMIGDNVYADIFGGKWYDVDPDLLWDRYVTARLSLQIYFAKDLIPTYTTWDDHDFGKNNSDKNYQYKKESLEIYHSFWPNKREVRFYSRGPGVSSLLELPGQRFVFLDDRYFRSKNKKKEQQTQFGKVQEDWLFQILNSSNKPTFLVNGGQFFGSYHPYESYEGSHPESFALFLQRLKKAKAPVIFVSGDRHLSELMRIEKSQLGYETREFTSSGMQARVFKNSFKKHPNPRQIKGIDGTHTYGIMDSAPSSSGLTSHFSVFSPGKTLVFEETFLLKKK